MQDIGAEAFASISELVAALECDYDRLEELRNDASPDDAEELAELRKAAGDCADRLLLLLRGIVQPSLRVPGIPERAASDTLTTVEGNKAMRIKQIKLYEFGELSDDAKKKARDWYRDETAGDSDWSEFTEDDFRTIAGFCGWNVDKIFWSGFWSQGDGAQFTGTWRADRVNVSGLNDHAPRAANLEHGAHYATLYEAADTLAGIAARYPEGFARVSSSGRDVHEKATIFDVEFGDDMEPDEETESALIEASRDLMRFLYRSLEVEYEYRNDDAQVDDLIAVNEYEFTEDGRIA